MSVANGRQWRWVGGVSDTNPAIITVPIYFETLSDRVETVFLETEQDNTKPQGNHERVTQH